MCLTCHTHAHPTPTTQLLVGQKQGMEGEDLQPTRKSLPNAWRLTYRTGRRPSPSSRGWPWGCAKGRPAAVHLPDWGGGWGTDTSRIRGRGGARARAGREVCGTTPLAGWVSTEDQPSFVCVWPSPGLGSLKIKSPTCPLQDQAGLGWQWKWGQHLFVKHTHPGGGGRHRDAPPVTLKSQVPLSPWRLTVAQILLLRFRRERTLLLRVSKQMTWFWSPFHSVANRICMRGPGRIFSFCTQCLLDVCFT